MIDVYIHELEYTHIFPCYVLRGPRNDYILIAMNTEAEKEYESRASCSVRRKW